MWKGVLWAPRSETQKQGESRRVRKSLCRVPYIYFTLKSLTLQISNKFTKLTKCLLKENFLNGLAGVGWNRSPMCFTWDGDRWYHKEINVFHTWHLSYPKDAGDWGSEKLINFTKIIQQWCITYITSTDRIEPKMRLKKAGRGCLSAMSTVFTLCHMLYSERFLPRPTLPIVVIVVTIECLLIACISSSVHPTSLNIWEYNYIDFRMWELLLREVRALAQGLIAINCETCIWTRLLCSLSFYPFPPLSETIPLIIPFN